MKKEEKEKWQSAGVADLESRILELKNQWYNLRQQLRLGQNRNYTILRNIRRDIARLETFRKGIDQKNGKSS